MRRLAALATITTAAAIGVVGLAGTASAADGETATGVITQSTSTYSRPTTGSEALDQLAEGDRVDVVCVAKGAPIGRDPFGNPMWFKVVQSGTSPGYIHMSMVTPAPDSPKVILPAC